LLFGVRVLPAPIMRLRSPGRFGILPPDLAWRGADGLFLGEGIHVPWTYGDTRNGLDISAGAYVAGGAAVGSSLRTPISTTRVRWDHRERTGLVVDARGGNAAEPGARRSAATAWDVDLARGARAVLATTPLDTAARPFDRASLEVAWRPDGVVFASSVRSVSERGGELFDVGAAGPVMSIRTSGSVAGHLTYDALVDGGALSRPYRGATSFARGETGIAWATRAGPLGISVSARGAADVATNGVRRGAQGNATSRMAITLPLARAYATANDGHNDRTDRNDPVIHRIEPRISAAAIVVRGWTSSFGRVGARQGSEYTASGGVVGTKDSAMFAVRNRGSIEFGWAAFAVDHGHIFSPREPSRGDAFAARARLGERDGLALGALLTARDGADPVIARALLDASQEPSSGFLAEVGWTAGVRVAVPWSRFVATTAGVDADVAEPRLLAARGGIELRDGCGCLILRVNGAHRIGRPGVDVWVNLDIRPPIL
jgi:hypothetical protein